MQGDLKSWNVEDALFSLGNVHRGKKNKKMERETLSLFGGINIIVYIK